jgi:hypothetical protein
MSNEQGYEGEISAEEENAYYAAQAQWEEEAEARAQMEAAIQEQADQDYYESQMEQQAQEEYDRQSYELIEQLREVYRKKRLEKSFEGFPKMARLSREIVITEKIDGTNAQILITEDGEVLAGSRTRFITPEDDNYGFAKWVKENEEELKKLGPGRHFGEWWGSGCQRGYGLTKGEKRFSLFNTSRWNSENIPSCCYVVPELYRGDFDTNAIEQVLSQLADYGSVASPGFMNPEGIVIYHTAAGVGFKKTIKNDDVPKTKVK